MVVTVQHWQLVKADQEVTDEAKAERKQRVSGLEAAVNLKKAVYTGTNASSWRRQQDKLASASGQAVGHQVGSEHLVVTLSVSVPRTSTSTS